MSSVQVDLQANLVHITPDSTVPIPLAEVPRAIRAAGYQPGDMVLQARADAEAVSFERPGWTAAAGGADGKRSTRR